MSLYANILFIELRKNLNFFTSKFQSNELKSLNIKHWLLFLTNHKLPGSGNYINIFTKKKKKQCKSCMGFTLQIIDFFSVNHFSFLRQCFLQSWLALNLWSFYLYLPNAETSCCFLTSPPLPPFLLLKTETCFKNLQSWLASNF